MSGKSKKVNKTKEVETPKKKQISKKDEKTK
jgi:hypothetical protein